MLSPWPGAAHALYASDVQTVVFRFVEMLFSQYEILAWRHWGVLFATLGSFF